MNLLDTLYTTRGDDVRHFGTAWCGPAQLPHGEQIPVARCQGEGDGQSVEVFCIAMPARFYTLRVLPGRNSVGEPLAGYECGTGSGPGCAKWAADTASLIAQGMVSFKGGA